MSRSVVLVDAVRTPFGKAGGMYAGTRADDLMVRAIRGLLDRNPKVDHSAIDRLKDICTPRNKVFSIAGNENVSNQWLAANPN